MSDFRSVYVTAGSEEAARSLARELLGRRLVACANFWPVRSLYWWEGRVEESEEHAMLLKTRADLLDDVVAAVRDLHDYDVPCAVAFPIEGGHAPYLDWVERETARPR